MHGYPATARISSACASAAFWWMERRRRAKACCCRSSPRTRSVPASSRSFSASGNEGFGEGNFKALFESLELDQVRRGVLSLDKGVAKAS